MTKKEANLLTNGDVIINEIDNYYYYIQNRSIAGWNWITLFLIDPKTGKMETVGEPFFKFSESPGVLEMFRKATPEEVMFIGL